MRVLVTGGGGYIGRHVVAQLCARGDEVVVVGRRTYPAVEALGATCVVCDLSDPSPAAVQVLTAAMAGCDAVVHAAALPPFWAPREVFQATNVGGTQRVVQACRAAGVPRLVYTSSPSATFDGTDAVNKTAAECPYPDTFETPYAATKAEAEQFVLAAHGMPLDGGSGTLATTSLRPHLVYGPDEPHMVPRLIDRQRSGRLSVVGEGQNMVGLTYVDNAASAHLAALDALGPASANGGKAYFIHDANPVVLWTWISDLLEGAGVGRVTRSVSLATARRVGWLLEWVWTLLPMPGDPPMTRFIAAQLATSHHYDLSEAQRDFGWVPAIDGKEGFERMMTSVRDAGTGA